MNEQLVRAATAGDVTSISGAGAAVVHLVTAAPQHRSLLHISCAANQPAVAQYLIDSGASVDLKDGERFTPLHLAAECGSAHCVQILLFASYATLSLSLSLSQCVL
jgi:antitoxin (DNA-binding transcriptional repressor) of toxin-antitoxin stability system